MLKRLVSGPKVVRGGSGAALELDYETPFADSGLIFLRERTVLTTRELWPLSYEFIYKEYCLFVNVVPGYSYF